MLGKSKRTDINFLKDLVEVDMGTSVTMTMIPIINFTGYACTVMSMKGQEKITKQEEYKLRTEYLEAKTLTQLAKRIAGISGQVY